MQFDDGSAAGAVQWRRILGGVHDDDDLDVDGAGSNDCSRRALRLSHDRRLDRSDDSDAVMPVPRSAPPLHGGAGSVVTSTPLLN